MPASSLVVLVKDPKPGAVKTRLAPTLGPELAARLYRALAEGVLEATAPAAGEYELAVFYDPPQAADAVRAWLPALRLWRQSAGDLGARLVDAFDRLFARGVRRVAAIGSDLPGLTRRDVIEAFAALERADVVLGPAEDGGYYLVALRAPQHPLFEGISWSTPRVMDETVARASALGLSLATLARRRDVDTVADLRAAWPEVAPLLTRDPGLRQLIERVL